MTRCSACPVVNRCLPPDGPRGEMLFIGEAPGKDEDRSGRVFVGKTGQEVNEHYLPLANLHRDRLRFINTIACWPNTPGHKLDSKNKGHRELMESCAAHHLYPEITDNPHLKLLIPMGAIACRAVDPSIDLDLQHGLTVDTQWGIPAFPMYHPARGIHEPKKMLQIRNDWMTLKRYLRGEDVTVTDSYAGREDYAEIHDDVELGPLYLDFTQPLACDTEHSRSLGAYCLTLTQTAGTGRLIRGSRADLLQTFQDTLNRWEGPILFHNWSGYDGVVVPDMGLRFPHALMRDTMVEVYHLGNLPQGLKALAYRELGMLMQDFDDLVKPYSTERVLAYYDQAQLHTWPKPPEEWVRDPKTRELKLYKPQSMNTKLKRFFTDYLKAEAADHEKDVFKMWEDNWTDQQAMIEEKMGPWPGLDIAHVPFEKTLFYACRDVDALIRLWPLIEWMRSRVGQVPQERWRDAT